MERASTKFENIFTNMEYVSTLLRWPPPRWRRPPPSLRIFPPRWSVFPHCWDGFHQDWEVHHEGSVGLHHFWTLPLLPFAVRLMTERPSTNREAFSEQTVITFLPWKHLILSVGKKAGLFFYGDANVIFVRLKSQFLVPLICLIRKVSAAYYLLSFLLVFYNFHPLSIPLLHFDTSFFYMGSQEHQRSLPLHLLWLRRSQHFISATCIIIRAG